jgi:hypothetical protein
MWCPFRRQRGHRASGVLMVLHVGNGSPQMSQSGGVSGRTERQQSAQTGPADGASSSAPQDAQAGARTTDRTASQRSLSRLQRVCRGKDGPVSRSPATRTGDISRRPRTVVQFRIAASGLGPHSRPYRRRFSQSALRLMPRRTAALVWLPCTWRNVAAM